MTLVCITDIKKHVIWWSLSGLLVGVLCPCYTATVNKNTVYLCVTQSDYYYYCVVEHYSGKPFLMLDGALNALIGQANILLFPHHNPHIDRHDVFKHSLFT